VNRYREVVPELAGGDYRYSAREALSRTTLEERAEFGKQLGGQSLHQGYDFPDPMSTTWEIPSGTPITPRGCRPGCAATIHACWRD
jgi:hypothetical protein